MIDKPLDSHRQSVGIPRQNDKATALASWMTALHRYLCSVQVDADALFREVGLDPAVMQNAEGRYPVVLTTALWEKAAAVTQDEALGLKVARNIRPGTFHALGYSVIASPTLRSAFERMQKFFLLVSDAGVLTLEEKDTTVILHLATDPNFPPSIYSVDSFLSLLVHTCYVLSGNACKPLEIYLRRSAPDEAALQTFHKMLGCPVHFDSPNNELLIDREWLDKPLEGGNPLVAQHLDEAAATAVARIKVDTLADKALKWLSDKLKQGTLSGSIDEPLAQHLCMSTRNLQRKLADEHTSITELVDQVRQQHAKKQLLHGHEPITQLAFDLGFSDPSSFSRACKRWFGVSPSEMRQHAGKV